MPKMRFAAIVVVVSVLAGCTVSNVATQGFSAIPAEARLVLMPPDIKYYRITASGITEPQSEWTDTARASFDAAFQAFTADSDLPFELLDRSDMSDLAVDYDKLHSAVGSTILANHYGITKLPSKRQGETNEYDFDWSLGPGVAELTPQGGDYALFVFFRDYEAGGGRVGMAIFAAALGVGIYTGHQGGFASLVDLRSGDVVWFNNVPVAQGDMRKPDGARRLVDQLFDGLTGEG